MKKLLSVILLCFSIFGCSSAKLVSNAQIPEGKETIYLNFDNTQTTVDAGGVVIGNMIFSDVQTASLNTLNNRMLAKDILTEKGYKVTQKLENADMILYAGCESSEVKTVVTIVLVDAKTEEEYAVANGSYGMGMDLNGDIKGALKNALQSIPKSIPNR